MTDQYLHKINARLNRIKPIYILVLLLVFVGLTIFGMRQNNFEMIRLREAVIKADQENGDTEKALFELRKHVHSHMNTNLVSGDVSIKPPIQLKARYERLMAAEQEKIKQTNTAVTAQGEAICGGQFPGEGFNTTRVACVQEYISRHAAKPSNIAEDLYKFDFVSPRWSPDLAGWSLLATIILFFLLILRFLVVYSVRKY